MNTNMKNQGSTYREVTAEDTVIVERAENSVCCCKAINAEVTLADIQRISRHLHTPLKKCSLTADDGASPPLKWCTNSAEMVHGGRRRGARGRHAGNHSGMPLRLRMDSPSIWMV